MIVPCANGVSQLFDHLIGGDVTGAIRELRFRSLPEWPTMRKLSRHASSHPGTVDELDKGEPGRVINRLCVHLFRAARQFVTTVRGGEDASPTDSSIRNRLPSFEG